MYQQWSASFVLRKATSVSGLILVAGEGLERSSVVPCSNLALARREGGCFTIVPGLLELWESFRDGAQCRKRHDCRRDERQSESSSP